MLTKYLTALGVVIAALLATAGALYLRLNAVIAERNVAQVQLAAVTAERDAVLGVIPAEAEARTKIQAALAKCVSTAQDIERTAADALAQARAALTARNRALADLRAEREKWNASDPACAAWSRDTLCPAASRGLRLLWSGQAVGGGEARGGGGAAPAVRADPGQPHDAAAVAAAPDPVGLQEADCYSNAQLYDALESVLSAYRQAGDQFEAIERIQARAVEATDGG